MDLMFVKPREGLRIRDPMRRDRLPADSYRRVELIGYWQRLAAMGDVVLAAEVPEHEIEGYEPPLAGEAETAAPDGQDHG